MFSFRTLFIFLLFFFAFQPSVAEAFVFSFQTQEKSGEFVEVDVVLESDSEIEINLLETSVIYPYYALTFMGFSDQDSVVRHWISRPKVSQTGKIYFSGGIPGGLSVPGSGKVVTLLFKPRTDSEASLSFEDSSVFLHNAKGERLEAEGRALSFFVTATDGDKKTDIDGQEYGAPEFVLSEARRDPEIFDGRWVLYFQARDDRYGVAGYEVREGRSVWREAESPYVLSDVRESEDVFIKAISHSGAETEVSLEVPVEKDPDRGSFWYKFFNSTVFLTIFVLILLLTVLFLLFRRGGVSKR